MGAAVDLAMSELAAQKQAYKAAGLEYYRPWLFLISDGAPTDAGVFTQASDRLRTLEAAKGVSVFSVAVAGADMTVSVAALRRPAAAAPEWPQLPPAVQLALRRRWPWCRTRARSRRAIAVSPSRKRWSRTPCPPRQGSASGDLRSMWNVVGGSATGKSHLRNGTECQDSHGWLIRADGVVCLSVADGAGSRPRSGEGSQAAVEAVLDWASDLPGAPTPAAIT